MFIVAVQGFLIEAGSGFIHVLQQERGIQVALYLPSIGHMVPSFAEFLFLVIVGDMIILAGSDGRGHLDDSLQAAGFELDIQKSGQRCWGFVSNRFAKPLFSFDLSRFFRYFGFG